MSQRKPARTIKAQSASEIRSKAAGSGPGGATIATVTRSTGWQPHTVRAFLAAVVRNKLGLKRESEKTDGERVYRIVAGKASAELESEKTDGERVYRIVAGKASADAMSVPSA